MVDGGEVLRPVWQGVQAALHEHDGRLVEREDELERVAEHEDDDDGDEHGGHGAVATGSPT